MTGQLITLESNVRRLVAGLSTRRPEFVNGPVHAKFIVDDVELGKVYTGVLRFLRGPGSSVGIATDYGLDGPGIESR